VLDEVHRWDDVTAGVVLGRLAPTTDLSFFTLTENGIVSPLMDLLLGQTEGPRVPVVAMIDARLAAGETDGWHYDDMPPDAEAWRLTLAALDADARELTDRPFPALSPDRQAGLVQRVQDLAAAGKEWHDWPAERVWSLWTRYGCAAFYSHPWAWNEMGFPGPAYPRGYKNIGVDARERFEVADHDDVDPVPFAERVERARRRHARHLDGGEDGDR
jgi:gluconate 2-dehydrogenase subunit 3-like protein